MMDKLYKDNLKLKKMVSVLLVILCWFSMLVGNCSIAQAASNTSKKANFNFIGKWFASAYEPGTQNYTAYLVMNVEEDGSFYIIDGEAGNPGLDGVFTIMDATTIQLDCNSDDFDSPWPKLKLKDQLEYHFYNENQVRITYGDTSILFSREGKQFFFYDMLDSNWHVESNREWYSNTGVKASVTYKFRFENDTMLLYRVKNRKETFIGSFIVLNYDKRTGVVKAITELSDASKLPKNWRGMKEGRHFQYFKFNYNAKKHCVAITFNKKSYSFYSNITYGVSFKSDYYKVMDREWKCKDGDVELGLTTYIEWLNNSHYLRIYDYNASLNSLASGIIEVDEAKKKVSITWNKETTQDFFYTKYENVKEATYFLGRGGNLVVEYGGHTYTFTKKK